MKKRIFAAAALAAATAGSAIAADLPVKAPVYPPEVMPYNWTGLYVGGHIGWGWGRKTWSNPGILLSEHDVDGFLGGAQVGFNYQIQNFVLGIDADGSAADISGDGPDQFGDSLRDRTRWLASLTARLGFAWDRWLIYGKGGAAWAGDQFSFLAPSGRNASTDQTRSGWTAGAGIEYGIWDNWSLRLEYDYMDFGTKHVTWVTGDFADIEQKIHVVKVGLNYRFAITNAGR